MEGAPQRYTPDQVLQAGRRAEADGKVEYAIQFYRYVTDRYAASSEAQEAHLGLLRIAEAHGALAVSDAHIENAMAGTATSGNGAVTSADSLSRLKQKPAQALAKTDKNPAKTALALTPPPAGRVEGRLLAVACVVAGFLAVAGGIAVAAMGFLIEADGRPASAATSLGGLLIGSLMALAGLGTALVGQLGRALLGHAQATRQLLDLEQRKIGRGPEATN